MKKFFAVLLSLILGASVTAGFPRFGAEVCCLTKKQTLFSGAKFLDKCGKNRV